MRHDEARYMCSPDARTALISDTVDIALHTPAKISIVGAEVGDLPGVAARIARRGEHTAIARRKGFGPARRSGRDKQRTGVPGLNDGLRERRAIFTQPQTQVNQVHLLR